MEDVVAAENTPDTSGTGKLLWAISYGVWKPRLLTGNLKRHRAA